MTTGADEATALQPVALASAAQHAAEQLRKAIVAGHLPGGSRLVEAELADQMNMSRGPVREALQQLHREGLVRLRKNRGAVVAGVTMDDVLEVYAIRSALGSLALRHLIATNMAGPGVIRRLEALLTRACAVEGASQSVYLEAELEFQNGVVGASGLPRVIVQFKELSVEILRFINVLGVQYEDRRESLEEDTQLLEAIRRQDLMRAEGIWHTRFRRAVTQFAESLPNGEQLSHEHPWLLTAMDEYMGQHFASDGH